MKNNLRYTYYVAKGGTIDHPDKDFGKGVFAVAFAIELLYEAYVASQFLFRKAEILSKSWSLLTGCARSNVGYLNAAKLAGYTFLCTMQNEPASLGLHDRYYGGFANCVSIADAWDTTVSVENMYSFIGLLMLTYIYDRENASYYRI
jgi:hypothetical protein